jgi:hypothetical protein
MNVACPIRWLAIFALASPVLLASASAFAQEAATPPEPARKLGGHLGVAVPLVMVTSDDTTTVADAFVLAHPIGIGFGVADRLAVDFEMIVANPIDPTGNTGLTIDPGLIYDAGPVALGLRAAFNVGVQANFGLIPLVNRGLVDFGGAKWFVEAAFPTFYSDHELSFNVVAHTGIGF